MLMLFGELSVTLEIVRMLLWTFFCFKLEINKTRHCFHILKLGCRGLLFLLLMMTTFVTL